MADGPLPAHYEPQESPFRNPLYGQQHNPVRQIIRHPRSNRYQPGADEPGAEVFPYVLTTYRLTEHHTAGGMSLAQTAMPAWHEARRELPFVFTGSAAASGGGLRHAFRRQSPRRVPRVGWPRPGRRRN